MKTGRGMNRTFETIRAITLDVRTYGENHLWVTLFSEKKGVVRCTAYGAATSANELARALIPMTYGIYFIRKSAAYSERDQSQQVYEIKQAQILKGHQDVAADPARSLYALTMCDWVRATEGAEGVASVGELFRELEAALRLLSTQSAAGVLCHFGFRMVRVLGIDLQGTACLRCSESGELVYSFREAGYLCTGCAAREPFGTTLSVRHTSVMRKMVHTPLWRINAIHLRDTTANILLRALFTILVEQAGISSKPLRVLTQMREIFDES